MLQIRKLHLRRKGIRLDFFDVIHIRHAVIVRHQQKRFGDLPRKALLRQVVNRHLRILHYIMQKSDTDRILIIHLLGKMKRMIHIGNSAFIELVFMRLKRDFQGFFGQVCIQHSITPLRIIFSIV